MAYVIRRGYTGLAVKKMQHYLNVLRTSYPDLPVLKEDGSFGSATENAVMIFQKHTGLTADGIIGTLTWDKIIAKYKAAPGPGTGSRSGSRHGTAAAGIRRHRTGSPENAELPEQAHAAVNADYGRRSFRRQNRSQGHRVSKRAQPDPGR